MAKAWRTCSRPMRPFVEGFEAAAQDDPADQNAPLKLAIVGRPNAGKSTLINKMLEEDRLITGPEAGITRDSITVDWIWHDAHLSEEDQLDGIDPDRRVRLIDTAGMRKRAKVNDKLEKLSVADAKRAIDFAEVVVLAAGRDQGAGSAGFADCGSGHSGRPLSGDRDQQMGRGGRTECVVQRNPGGAG